MALGGSQRDQSRRLTGSRGPNRAVTRLPRSNLEYWKPKLEGNVRRDEEKDAALRALGWSVLVIWECELKTETDVSRAAAMVLSMLPEAAEP